MPAGFKVFLWSLVCGVAGGGASFKLILYFATRWAGEDDFRQVVALALAVLGALAIGVSAAVTAGVMTGKKLKA